MLAATLMNGYKLRTAEKDMPKSVKLQFYLRGLWDYALSPIRRFRI
jgi:hypothetical protein